MDVQSLMKKVSNLFATRDVQRAASSVLSATVLLSTSLSAAYAAPNNGGSIKDIKIRPLLVNPVGAKRYVDDELIVVPQKGLDKEEFNDSVKAIDGEVIAKDLLGIGYLVRVPKQKLEKDYQKALKDKNFSVVQKNMISRAQFTTNPNDPGFQAGLQGCLTQLNIPNAWALGAAGQGVVFGIMDTGVDYRGNQDMIGRTTGFGGGQGYNSQLNSFIGIDEDLPPPLSFGGHGTFVSNCFGASTNNNFGFAAGAFQASIIPCCILQTDNTIPFGEVTTNDFFIARAVQFLEVNGCLMANLSFGQTPPESFFDIAAHPFLQLVLAQYGSIGGICFIAAGNDGLSDVAGVANAGMVPVAAVDSTGTPASFTNFGPMIQFAAPGVNITNTLIGGTTVTGSGTSFASPYCASVAALVKSVRPGLSNQTVLQIMRQTATPGLTFPQSNLFYGAGIPNAAAAVRLAQTSF